MTITVIALISSDTSAGYDRSTADVIRAIGLVAPWMPAASRRAYAKTYRAVARKHNIDELSLVALAWEESGHSPSKVNGPDWGLMQIRPSAHRSCADPNSAACTRLKTCAMNGHCAIRRIGGVITEARRICKTKTKRAALFHRWLQMLAGLNHPRRQWRGVWCGQKLSSGKWKDIKWKTGKAHRGVRQVIACRRNLIRNRTCHRESRSGAGRSR